MSKRKAPVHPVAEAAPTPGAPEFSCPVAVDDIPRSGLRRRIEASGEERAALARRYGLVDLDALAFNAEATPWRGGGMLVTGRLTAQATQRCVVTLQPVPAEIDETIRRGYLPDHLLPEVDPGAEIPLALDPELDDAPDVLPATLDLGEIAAEGLALALDPWPRAEGAELGQALAGPPESDPLTDEAAKPLAGLAALKKRMEEGE